MQTHSRVSRTAQYTVSSVEHCARLDTRHCFCDCVANCFTTSITVSFGRLNELAFLYTDCSNIFEYRQSESVGDETKRVDFFIDFARLNLVLNFLLKFCDRGTSIASNKV